MLIRLFVVYDKVALESGPVFSAKNGSVARRKFITMLKDDQGVINPEDYDLLEVAKYDNETSVVEGYEVPETIMTGFDAKSFGGSENE